MMQNILTLETVIGFNFNNVIDYPTFFAIAKLHMRNKNYHINSFSD